ncbi:MAG: DUF5615 family PIN-like protein [Magnetococcales bacterium]|nr:DUF5615 family PIN-like protein [Magnetococcales bacterium]
MKFKIDENLPSEVSVLLRGLGHDAVSVLDQDMGGMEDGKIFSVCREERRILVTLDLDFANVQVYPPSKGSGIMVLRLACQDKSTVMEVLHRLLPILESESPDGRLWIVEEKRIRMRE